MPGNELEALVGHLFVVGGRAISSASPGAIAMPAPRKVARGRETDTLFALIALSEVQHQSAAFYERLTTDLSSTYFSTPGSLTSALREAVASINETVRAMNERESAPIPVGLACGILREHSLVIATVGHARCFLAANGIIERLPSDDEGGDTPRSLGSDAEPDLRLYQRDVSAGHFLVMSDGALNRLSDGTLAQAVQGGEVDSTLTQLRSAAGQFASAIVVKFVAPLAEAAQSASPRPPLEGLIPGLSRPRAAEKAAARAEKGGSADEAGAPERMTVISRAGRAVAMGLVKIVEGTQTLVSKMMPDASVENPLEERLRLSTPMQVGIAIAVAIIVAVLTIVIYNWRGQTSQYAQLIREAQKEVDQARGGGGDQGVARPHWETAVFLFQQAQAIRPLGPEIVTLQNESLAALDSYDHVTRVSPVLMREYQAGSVLRGPVLQGLNIYVIDTTNDILYREDLDQNGTGFVGPSQIITRTGEQVSGQVVGGLIDLTWVEEGGIPQRNVMAAIARNGLLITYSPSWNVTAVVLPGFEAWQDPRAMAVYNRDLYIMDAGANEIWRYQANADSYASLPQRYFTDVVPQLGDALDMEIDTNGNIYILHSSGKITKYFFGREQPFAFEGLPQPVSRPTALNISLSLLDRNFFISDPGGGRLYAVALNGTFLTNYKDAQNNVFDTIGGVASQDRPSMIYLVAGNRLLYFPRPQ
jgi:hypothetical protein